jgi:hypothetical protein
MILSFLQLLNNSDKVPHTVKGPPSPHKKGANLLIGATEQFVLILSPRVPHLGTQVAK